MRLEQLQLIGIRLYDRVEVEFPPEFTVFYGPNGCGKTTILEAAHFLMTLKSFRSSRSVDLIKTGHDEAAMEGRFGDPTHRARVELLSRGRRLLLDEKKVSRSSQFCRDFSVVALCPEHQGILSGPPEERRRYLDRVLFGQDPRYLDTAQRYQKALKQKRALLKTEPSFHRYEDLVSPWNQEITVLGEGIREARRNLVSILKPRFRDHHQTISQEPGVDLHYQCPAEGLEEELSTKMSQEFAAGRTLFGPHRDDLLISLRDRKASEVASQGERASLLLSLKLSEIELAEENTQTKPILLLDDLGATLDMGRRERLLEFLRDGSHQTLITTTEPSLVEVLQASGSVVMRPQKAEVEQGISFARWLPA